TEAVVAAQLDATTEQAQVRRGGDALFAPSEQRRVQPQLGEQRRRRDAALLQVAEQPLQVGHRDGTDKWRRTVHALSSTKPRMAPGRAATFSPPGGRPGKPRQPRPGPAGRAAAT